MQKSKFTERHMIAILKAVEAGRTVKDVCREPGISDAVWPPYAPDCEVDQIESRSFSACRS